MTKMSVSASAENLASDAQGGSYDGGSMCLELALEGERLCKAGDCRAGVAFFQAAIQAGTDDLRTLSAIYSQLGNAYFYLGDYAKAMQFHRHDLTLARTMGDKLGEAKASGNLGNTLKVMGKFVEAIQCCKRHLDISQELGDRLSEGRALYNLGNVYHAQGKQLGRVGQNDPGHFAPEVRECLMQAISFYEQNLYLMQSLGDRQACGRACGNLGNTCYLLGDFGKAIKFHTERLQIAQEFGDRAAERRANSNLGNSHIFLGQFENAAEHYKHTLQIAEELGDAAVEAQACYSLGNTYTLLREYRTAEQFHSRHLSAARKLQDRVGEGRACWSLGNAHAALGNHEKALYYASEHFNISKELGDSLGMATAKMNMGDLRKVLGLPQLETESIPVPSQEDSTSPQTPFNALRVRRQSMEQLSLIQITPNGKSSEMDKNEPPRSSDSEENPAESFFDLLSRCQSERMDDQRATLNANANRENRQTKPKNAKPTETSEDKTTNRLTIEMVNLWSALQTESMNAQRTQPAQNAAGTSQKTEETAKTAQPAKPKANGEVPKVEAAVGGEQRISKATSLPGSLPGMSTKKMPVDDFLDMIARVQGSRLEDQRTELPPLVRETVDDAKADFSGASSLSVASGTSGISAGSTATGASFASGSSGVSVASGSSAKAEKKKVEPDEDFFNYLFQAQAGRLDDQRATIPAPKPAGKK